MVVSTLRARVTARTRKITGERVKYAIDRVFFPLRSTIEEISFKSNDENFFRKMYFGNVNTGTRKETKYRENVRKNLSG